MPKIQVDMFAVELGLAMLLQFDTGQDKICVLADAGSKKYNVNDHLKAALVSSSGSPLRIDLMIGTHYDGDHLNGLVDIIKNPNIQIGEAWMPPVANDSQPPELNFALEDENLLGIQFAEEDGDATLEDYLRFKANMCESCFDKEQVYEKARGLTRESDRTTEISEMETLRKMGQKYDPNIEGERYFRAHLEDARQTLGALSMGHADHEIRGVNEVDAKMEAEFERLRRTRLRKNGTMHLDHFPDFAHYKNVPNFGDSRALAHIRAAAAEDAINAKALAKVVKALKARNIPTRFATIEDGRPRKFSWNAHKRRFEARSNTSEGAPNFTLLGPSKGLVKKHWNSIPIGAYTYASFLKSVPIEKITPSNELSYIGVFECLDQRILISGDAGCVDFRPAKNKPFHQKLIDELGKLDIVQIAHHAGHNAYFYNSLLASQFVDQANAAYLLLSHRTDDKYRPSAVFREFIEKLKKGPDEIQLLFSSKPREQKVRDYKDLCAPTVGRSAKNGNVRLVFENGTWEVASHKVSVT